METWSYVFGERGFAYEDSVTASNFIARCRNGSMDWEYKSPFYSSNIGSGSSSQEAIENMGILNLGFQETMRKSVSNGSNKLGSVRMLNPLTENGSVVKFNCVDSALIDLKLGRFSYQRDAQNLSTSQTTPNMYKTDSPITTKRIRVGGLNSLIRCCQVFGCKKDLSSCKEYHKRHKVCEVHSKTPIVIVNGIEQRFCQQCSRFHLLVEFDDGKRSCRKHLAFHNERRRKPHGGIHSSRSGKWYQTYNNGSAGSRFQRTMIPSPSFIRQDVLPICLSNQHKSDKSDWCRHIKLEEGPDYSSQSAVTVADVGLHSKSPFPYGFDKLCSPMDKSGVYDVSKSKPNGNSNQYLF